MIRLYTKSYDIGLLKQTGNSLFTGEEYARVTEVEFAKILESKESAIRYDIPEKLKALCFLICHIMSKGYKNVLSLGAGRCTLEYLMKEILPEDIKIVATDFNQYYLNRAKHLFPEVTVLPFDFFKDDVMDITKNTGIKFDVAVFLGSAYAMDDKTFIKLFSRLKEIGIKEIVDFHAGYLIIKDLIYYMLLWLKEYPAIRRLFRKQPIYRGKLHGYARTCWELRWLYKKAGWKIKEVCQKYTSEERVFPNRYYTRYIAILS